MKIRFRFYTELGPADVSGPPAAPDAQYDTDYLQGTTAWHHKHHDFQEFMPQEKAARHVFVGGVSHGSS